MFTVTAYPEFAAASQGYSYYTLTYTVDHYK